jgi:CBS domain containing-hemolysin-like protein
MSPWIVIVISLVFSAFFSGMEIAFISANRLRIELDKKQGGVSSKILAVVTKKPNQYIATMLVGNNIALVVYGIFMAILLEPVIRQFTDSESGILFIQTIISTLIILITAEFLPKTLFRLNPNAVLHIFSVPVYFFYYALFPIAWFTIFISNILINKLLGKDLRTGTRDFVFGKIDLNALVSEGTKEITQPEEKDNDFKMFQNALEFSSLKVRDCMIPRTEIMAMDVNVSINELNQKFVETGLSKILIYEKSVDNVIGYIHVKELFKNIKEIKPNLLPVSFVPETMSAQKLLQEFIKDGKSLSVVVDEFGGISGMLTIEDIMEEIFGEIEDEHDSIELIEQQTADNEYLFSGRLEIDYLNEKYNLRLPENDDYDTLAGLIIFHSEKIPMLNETIIVSQFTFKILKVTQTRIELIRVTIEKE